jgi:hypothetical protein
MKDMVNARYFLYERGWSPRLLLIELFSSALFVLFYFGTKIIGFIYITKQLILKKLTRFEISLLIALLVGIILAILFIQKGDWFNPIQFAVVSAFIMNYFAAKFLYELFSKKLLFYLVAVIVFIITVPAHFVNLGYLKNDARYVIPNAEMDALNFLKKQADGVVFSPIFDPDMAYVSAVSGKQTYVNFLNVLENNGINYSTRIQETEHMETIQIDALDVRYLYIPYTYKFSKELITKCKASLHFRVIYNKQNVVICEKTT